MDLNANFNERVSVHAAKLPWKSSPMSGVERRMLDRLGDDNRALCPEELLLPTRPHRR